MIELSHKNLTVWKKSLLLAKEMYTLTSKFPPEEKFGLTSQLRRAAVSVLSNLAEGAARKSDADKARFFIIARSSLVEIDSQIELVKLLSYTSIDDFDKLTQLANDVFAMLTKLIQKYGK